MLYNQVEALALRYNSRPLVSIFKEHQVEVHCDIENGAFVLNNESKVFFESLYEILKEKNLNYEKINKEIYIY